MARARDLTQGPIARTLILFALPTLGSNILQSLNGTINAVWVGRFLGARALAATANANLVLFLAISAVFGFGMAATILIGQAIGRRDLDGARRAFGSAVGAFGVASVVVAAFGFAFTPEILRALGTTPDVTPFAIDYLRVIFLALPGMFLSVLITMSLRGTGDSLTPLWFMLLSVALDSGLNPVFILGLGPAPKMGIAGAATATLIANVVTLTAAVVTIYARNMPLRLRGLEFRYLLPSPRLLKLVLGKGLPIGLQMIMVSLSGIAMMGLANHYGSDTAAAYGVALQMWTYVQMPALAVGAAVSGMAAQNIGARRWDRVGRITRAGVIINLAMTGGTVAALILFDHPVMALFVGGDSPVLPIARHIQQVATWGFILFGTSFVMFGTMRANGAVIGPLVVLTIAVLPVRIGFAAIGARWLGADALWLSFPLGSAVTMVGAIMLYMQNGWRRASLAVSPDEARERVEADGDTAGRMTPSG